MLNKPESRLAVELDPMTMHSAQTVSGSWVKAPAESTQAGVAFVQLPPAPATSWFSASLARDSRYDAAAVAQSRAAQRVYRAEYEERANYPYPLRMVQAPVHGLPTLLTGYLEQPPDLSDDRSLDKVIRAWLDQRSRLPVLVGLEREAVFNPVQGAYPLLQFTKVTRSVGAYTDGQVQTTAHVRYQQWVDGQWPVLGGEVVAHVTAKDSRIAITSSYFPVTVTGRAYTPQLAVEQAITLAQQTLAGYLDGPTAIGLYWTALWPWVKSLTTGKKPAAPWRESETAVVEKLLDAFVATYGEVAAERTRYEHTQQEAAQEALAQLAQTVKQVAAPWHAAVATHAGSALFLLPFAGNYHLAYQIELRSPQGRQAWRLFIDAETGTVLGAPENLLAHAPVAFYETSGAVQPSTDPTLDLADLQAKLTPNYMRLENEDGTPVNLGSFAAGDMAPPKLEASNIAFHADKILTHFLTVCGADPVTLQSYPYQYTQQTLSFGAIPTTTAVQGTQTSPCLRLVLGGAATAVADVGFSNAQAENPKPIFFPSAQGAPLTINGVAVHSPSLDPEVIYHEITHGLMWLLSHSPFDQQQASVPFGRALVEGYATYFARSLAARHPNDTADNLQRLWARKAYKGSDWQSRWGFARPIAAIGADLLPAPNLLAEGQTDTTGLPVYDLGMVWARALWDVRTLLDNHSAEVAWGPLRGADLADRLALDAYYYAHGWVANFEQAAEGLIDSARQKALPAEIIDTLIDLFADRLILADQGIQALVAYTDPADGLCLLAGSDAGLRRSHDQGANWQEWGQLAAGERLTGVVALQRNHSGDLLFAATEQGIYRRAVTDTKWSGVGTPPLPLLPLSMTVVGDQPFVGTGDGVWHLSADQWQRWGDLAGVAWQLADMVCQAGAGTIVTNRYATLIAGVRHRRVGNAAQLWTSSGSIPGALVTAVAGHDNRLYAGTLRDGIWRQDGTSCTQNAGITLSSWTQIVTPVQLAFAGADGPVTAAVLTLVAEANRLLAGTTHGLYEIALTPLPATPLSPVPGMDPAAVVIALCTAGDALLVGTARHGLWIRPQPGQLLQQVLIDWS